MCRNGRTPGVTLPSAEQQEAVVRKAYAQANVDLSETDYVECHGTGTAVGDPIEVEALGCCFMSRKRHLPLLIGGVSTPVHPFPMPVILRHLRSNPTSATAKQPVVSHL